MTDLFIIIILAMGVFFILGIFIQIRQHKKKPEVRYSCTICGEYDCICQKK
jgi:hypothetical protein